MTYNVMYSTLGMTLCAGQSCADSVDYAKPVATDLIKRRNLKKLDDAWIEDADGVKRAVLYMQAYDKNHAYEWLTLR